MMCARACACFWTRHTSVQRSTHYHSKHIPKQHTTSADRVTSLRRQPQHILSDHREAPTTHIRAKSTHGGREKGTEVSPSHTHESLT